MNVKQTQENDSNDISTSRGPTKHTDTQIQSIRRRGDDNKTPFFFLVYIQRGFRWFMKGKLVVAWYRHPNKGKWNPLLWFERERGGSPHVFFASLSVPAVPLPALVCRSSRVSSNHHFTKSLWDWTHWSKQTNKTNKPQPRRPTSQPRNEDIVALVVGRTRTKPTVTSPRVVHYANSSANHHHHQRLYPTCVSRTLPSSSSSTPTLSITYLFRLNWFVHCLQGCSHAGSHGAGWCRRRLDGHYCQQRRCRTQVAYRLARMMMVAMMLCCWWSKSKKQVGKMKIYITKRTHTLKHKDDLDTTWPGKEE